MDSSFSHYSFISDNSIIMADLFHLSLLSSINQVPTKYANNSNDTNLVINLMFLNCDLSELNNHFIHPEWHLSSDHVLLTIIISISDEVINLCKRAIGKNSVEEELFIKVVISSIKNLDISNLLDISSLDNTINNLAKGIDNT